MILGFTGTRRGVTGPQWRVLSELIEAIAADITEGHHGECCGADAEFHATIRRLAPHAKIVIHPPSDPSFRYRQDGDVILPEMPYLLRNADIVAACDVLIATPKEETEVWRGGTWSTVRKAVREGKPVTIVYPSGRTEER